MGSIRKATVHLAVLASTLCWALTVCAQAAEAPAGYAPCETQPTEGDTAAAKGAFQAGTAAYNEADYPRAITYWEDAFRRDCTATALLLNLARAYESSAQLEHAILALRTYNERNPDSPQRDQIDRRIERLQEQLDAQASAPPAPTTPAAARPPERRPNPPPDAAAETSQGPSAVPLVVAIAGGAIAVVGTAAYLKTASDTKAYEAQCPNRTCPTDTLREQAEDSRKKQQLYGAVALGGVAVGVAGTLWYYFESKRAARANAGTAVPSGSVRLAPALAPGYAGVNIGGQFSF